MPAQSLAYTQVPATGALNAEQYLALQNYPAYYTQALPQPGVDQGMNTLAMANSGVPMQADPAALLQQVQAQTAVAPPAVEGAMPSAPEQPKV